MGRKHDDEMDGMKLVNNADSDYGAVEKHQHTPHSRHEILAQARKKLILACLFSAALMIAQVVGKSIHPNSSLRSDNAVISFIKKKSWLMAVKVTTSVGFIFTLIGIKYILFQ